MAEGVFVIIGDDDWRVTAEVKKLVPEGAALETVDSLNSANEELRLRDLREAQASLDTPPFLEPEKVTWWKNVGFLPGGGRKGGEDGASEAVKAALMKFVEHLAATKLPANQRFVLSGPHLLKTSVVAKRLAAAGRVTVLSSGKPAEALEAAYELAGELARAAGLEFPPAVIQRFLSRVGTDSRTVASEFEKLRTYAGPGAKAIAAADVEAVSSVGPGTEPAFWDFTDAVGARQLKEALRVLAAFEDDKGFAVMMTTVLEKLFRQLEVLKDAEARGEVERVARGMAPFVLRKNLGFCRQWTLSELRAARGRFLALRERAVSSGGTTGPLVVTALVRTMTRG